MEQAESVDDVKALLGRCIEAGRDENSADAYFALLYLWETHDIAEAANAGLFDAPDELRRMVVTFANRYFAARAQFRKNAPMSRTWALAFRAASATSALVVQHILLAMNAHINVDLGIAAAETGMPWPDYARVDAILAQGVGRIQGCLNRTTPVLRGIDLFGGTFDEMFAVYSLKAARRQAFTLAQRLRAAPETERPAIIADADDCALRLGQRLLDPPLRDRLLLAAVRITERNVSPRDLLAMLERT